MVLVGAQVVSLGFANGGFFAGSTALAAAATGLFALVWFLAGPRPVAALTPLGITGIAAITGLAAFDLLSSTWSHSADRAILEFDRTLLYGLTFAVFATLPDGERTIRRLLVVLVAAFTTLAAAGFLARTAPAWIGVAAARDGSRLSWPTGYWNALGLAAALGVLLAVAVSADRGRHPAVRAAAVGTLPVLVGAGYLTLSRNAVLAVVAGVVVLAFGRGRAALLPALAGGVAAAAAAVVTFGQEKLVQAGVSRALLQAAGRPALLATAAATLGAAGAAFVLARRTQGMAPRPALARGLRRRITAAAVAVVLVAAGVAVATGVVNRVYHRAVGSGALREADPRDRLAQISTNGREEYWRVAWRSFGAHPLAGTGSGTYDITWQRDKRFQQTIHDAHSLYLETGAEKGVIGLVLLLVLLGSGLAAMVRRGAGVAAVGATAAVVAWLLHAGAEWDWEVPAVSLWLFAVLGSACARPVEVEAGGRSALRIVAALGIALLSVLPVQMARSQRDLNAARVAFARGDCATTIDRALGAAAIAGWRPVPFALLAVCDARVGLAPLARKQAAAALARDPHSWELIYLRALVDAATGRPDVRGFTAALRANPRDDALRAAVRRVRAAPQRQRAAIARAVKLPLGG